MKNAILERVNYLTAIAEEQNLTKAAERLFISQPALTAYLNRLEQELGVKLFDRSTKPICITPAGAYYISTLEKLSRQMSTLNEEVKQIADTAEMRLNVGIGRNRGSIWLPRILPAIYEMYPEAHINIIEGRDVSMFEQLTRGILDIAIVETYTYHSALSYLRLPDECHIMVTDRSNPLLAGRSLEGNSPSSPLDLPVDKLVEQMFICPNVNGALNRYTEWMFSTYNFRPRRRLYITNDITAFQLAVKGVGNAFQNSAYASLVHTAEQPVFVMPGGEPTVRKLFAAFNNESMSPLKRSFLHLTHDIMIDTLNLPKAEMEYLV